MHVYTSMIVNLTAMQPCIHMFTHLLKQCIVGKTSWDITSKLSAYVKDLDKKAKNRYIEKIS